MSENTVEFGILMGERIKAQIEIYEKFGESFSKTIDLLRENKESLTDVEKSVISKLNTIEESVVDQIRDIVKGLTQLSSDIKSQNDLDRERWLSFQRENQQTLNTFQNQIRDINVDKNLVPTIHTLVSELRKDTLSISDHISENQNAILPLITKLINEQDNLSKQMFGFTTGLSDQSNFLRPVPAQVQTLFDARSKLIDKTRVVKLALGFILGMITIIITLVQFFGMHLTFGK